MTIDLFVEKQESTAI